MNIKIYPRSKTQIVFGILFFFFSFCYSQKKETDELYQKIGTCKDDTTKSDAIYKFVRKIYKSYPDSAIRWCFKGLNPLKPNKSPLLQADFISLIGTVLDNKGNFDSAIVCQMDALKIREKFKDKKGIANSLNNLGQIYFALKNTNKAIEYYEKSLAIRLENKDQKAIAASYNNLGIAYEVLEDYDKALSFYNNSLKIKEKLADNKLSIAYTLENIGNVYALKEEFEKSKEYYKRSYTVYQETGELQGQASIIINIGKVCIEEKKFKEAITYLESQHQNVNDLNTIDIKIEYNKALSDAYEGIKDDGNALKYFKLFKSATDSLLSENNTKTVSELESKYSSEKKDSEIKLLNKEKVINEIEVKQKNSQLIFFSIIVVICILLLIVFIRNNNQKKKANTLLLNLNQELSVSKEEISHQRDIVQEKQKEILDSIHYAKRIQTTILAHAGFINENLQKNFVLFRPKDIVSGDFYWATKKDNLFYLAVCDSTGHGVPGAFMSLLNIGFLSEAINEKNIFEPNKVFDYVRDRLINSISKEGQQDGFDGILLCIDQKTKKMTYAAAHNSPIVISRSEIIHLNCDKMPVGIGVRNEPFKLYSIEMKETDALYLYTDGYADQFGGPNGKKFLYKKMNELIASLSNEPLPTQSTKLSEAFETWKGGLEQVDDVLVVGIRI